MHRVRAITRTVPVAAIACVLMLTSRSSARSPRAWRIRSNRPPKAYPAAIAAMTPNQTKPLAALPSLIWATRITSPRPAYTAGKMRHDCHHAPWPELELFIDALLRGFTEHLLHAGLEVPRQGDCQRYRRVIATGCDRVDRLPRHAHGVSQLLLGQPVFD